MSPFFSLLYSQLLCRTSFSLLIHFSPINKRRIRIIEFFFFPPLQWWIPSVVKGVDLQAVSVKVYDGYPHNGQIHSIFTIITHDLHRKHGELTKFGPKIHPVVPQSTREEKGAKSNTKSRTTSAIDKWLTNDNEASRFNQSSVGNSNDDLILIFIFEDEYYKKKCLN